MSYSAHHRYARLVVAIAALHFVIAVVAVVLYFTAIRESALFVAMAWSLLMSWLWVHVLLLTDAKSVQRSVDFLVMGRIPIFPPPTITSGLVGLLALFVGAGLMGDSDKSLGALCFGIFYTLFCGVQIATLHLLQLQIRALR